jgi:phage-related holin
MQYIIMLLLVVVAAVTDVLTGLLKARITTGYNSTTMRKGLYCKAINIFVMIFFIAVEIGMEWLGKYYGHEDLGKLVGGISALFAFTVIVLMESISIAENFAAANPKSPLAKVLASHLQKVGKQIEESEKEDKT